MTQTIDTGPFQARLARLVRTGGDAARARAREAARMLAADIRQELRNGRADAAETPTGATVTAEAPGLITREFGAATRAARPVIGPAVARLAGRE